MKSVWGLRMCVRNPTSVGGIDVDHDQRNLNIFLTIRRVQMNETECGHKRQTKL